MATPAQTLLEAYPPASGRLWMAFILPAVGFALAGYFATAVPGHEGPGRLIVWFGLAIAAVMPAVLVNFHFLRLQRQLAARAGFGTAAADAAAEPAEDDACPALIPSACDLAAVGDAVRAALKDPARRKGLGLDIVVDPRTGPPVMADAHCLARVLTALAANAVKFTEHGGVTVRIATLDESMSGCLLRFSVDDTGVGISREFQARLFGSYVSPPAPEPAPEGPEARLTTARKLTELMGGKLRISSEPGVGTRFWFDLRLAIAADAPTSDAAATISKGACCAEPRRILAAARNPAQLHLLREMLAADGHELTTAGSGTAALELLQDKDEWDIVLLDEDVPDMVAATLLQAYRFGASRPAPVFLIADDVSPAFRSAAEKSGAAGVLAKPIRAEEVRRAVAAAGSRSRGTDRDVMTPALRAVPIVYVDVGAIDRLAEIGARPGFLSEMIDQATADIDRNVGELTAALAAAEFERVRDAAHAIDCLAQDVGAVRLARLAASIMRRNAPELAARRQRLAGELRETAAHTVSALRNLRSRPRPPGTGTSG